MPSEMTEISFHTQVPDVLDYACRLVRKAYRRGLRLSVTGEPERLRRFDRALWVFDPLAFVPHLRLAPGATVPEPMADTPVWLLEPGAEAPVQQLLVNLGPDPGAGFEAYARLIEIVGTEPEAARAGRARWRHYSERGYRIEHHAFQAG